MTIVLIIYIIRIFEARVYRGGAPFLQEDCTRRTRTRAHVTHKSNVQNLDARQKLQCKPQKDENNILTPGKARR